jgi:type VI secretion system protein ImpH
MPTFYTEDPPEEASDDRNISRDFVDIINCPRITCSTSAGPNITSPSASRRAAGPTSWRGSTAFSFRNGEDTGDLRKAGRFLRYIGLATQIPRSAEGLRALISDCVENVH